MHFSIPLLILSLVYLLLVFYLYSSKQKVNNIETRLYFFLLIIGIIGNVLDLVGIYVNLNLPSTSIFRWGVVKLYLLYLLTFSILISIYVTFISFDKDNLRKKITKIISILYMIFGSLIVILPFKYFNDNKVVYVHGACCNLLYGVFFLNILYWLFAIIKSKNISRKKVIPILVFIVFSIPVVLLQLKHPELLLVTALASFIVAFMYHTIENPDVKVLEEVTIAKNNAERANRAKTDFLSSMSHEIRTPLNAIVGFSECILEEEDITKVKEDAKDIIMASQNLLEIVNGILDISKIEADKMEIINSEYCLLDNMNNIAKLMIPRIGEKPIVLKTKFAHDIPSALYGDIGKIKQIVTNLLTNAVKYTDKGIINFEINCINKDNICTIVISVEDTGRGIKPEKINNIFNKFERLEEDRNTTVEGTGLGLAITKRLAEMMGGKVVVQSKYGSGSKFTVYLKQKIINKTIESKEVSNDNTEFDCSNKRILVVDDNKINLKVAVRMLEPYKVYITTCERGLDCIDMVSKESFDLILLDDMMPELSGKETLVKLKEDINFNIPVVALTANAIEGMKEEYLKLGFDDYLAKPIDKLELERVLRKVLGNSKDVIKNTFEPLPSELFDMDIPLK